MGLLEKDMRSQNMQAVINNKLADRLNKLRDHTKTLKGHLIKGVYSKCFPEKLKWPWNEQVCQGVKCKVL